jgi:hypothetical protein
LIKKSEHESGGGTLQESGGSRSGVPFTMYFSTEQAEALATLSRALRVSKSTLVRYALERLLEQVANGQLVVPFGVKDQADTAL